jgi:hypothetical protein
VDRLMEKTLWLIGIAIYIALCAASLQQFFDNLKRRR